MGGEFNHGCGVHHLSYVHVFSKSWFKSNVVLYRGGERERGEEENERRRERREEKEGERWRGRRGLKYGRKEKDELRGK